MGRFSLILRLGELVLGTGMMALGLNMLLVPARIAAGGVSGLGVILYHLAGLPVGFTILILNLPLHLLAWIFLGKKFMARSLAGTVLLSLMVEVLYFVPVLTEDLLLASIYGGILLGGGLGLVFRSGSSTGGTALAAQLLHYFWGFSLGQGLLGIDFIIIALAGVVFNAQLAMYALISLFVTGKVVDFVQEGLSIAKACIIISPESQGIARGILKELDRGVTFLEGRGGYTGQELQVLLCVVSQGEVTRLKRIAWGVDPSSFVIVSNVHEVLGEGFHQP